MSMEVRVGISKKLALGGVAVFSFLNIESNKLIRYRELNRFIGLCNQLFSMADVCALLLSGAV